MSSANTLSARRPLGLSLLSLLVGILLVGACSSTPEPVPKPTKLNAVSQDSAARLRWSPGGISYVRDGYYIYRDTVPIPKANSDLRLTDLHKRTTYIDSSVANGTTYHYRVGGVNEDQGVGTLSEEVTVTPLPDPSRP